MRAVWFDPTDGKLTLESDVPVPQPSDNQLLIRVKLAEVTPAGKAEPAARPYIPGIDAVGTVERVGPNVKDFQIGDRVLAWFSGTYAEYAVVPENRAFRLPDNVSYDMAGTIGITYFMAYHSLVHKAGVKPEHTVLVHGPGASGALGLACVQVAKLLGIKVIGTACDSDGIGFIGHYGCTLAFTHNGKDQHCDSSDIPTYDVIIETQANANLAEDVEILSRGGTIVLLSCSATNTERTFDCAPVIAKSCRILGMNLGFMTEHEIQETGAFLIKAMQNGSVKPMISQEYPLNKVEVAQEVIRSSAKSLGSIVLAP